MRWYVGSLGEPQIRRGTSRQDGIVQLCTSYEDSGTWRVTRFFQKLIDPYGTKRKRHTRVSNPPSAASFEWL